MCGFAGFVDISGAVGSEALSASVTRMSDTLKHRGPDDSGVWVNPECGIALGHRRLSIIDVSAQGRQPMMSANKRYQIVFNGEIYNHRIIRKELERTGLRFRGHSDTEVLVGAIERWGLDVAMGQLAGMFAFALWDSQARVLYLARDRLGEKPLYYGWFGNIFAFGSELKALRAHPAWENRINRGAVALLMRFNYIPCPWSIYEDVYKLSPGCVLQIPHQALVGRASFSPHLTESTHVDLCPTRYWCAKTVTESGAHTPFLGSEDEAVDALAELLGNSVRQQMVADVPLGALLSGGIDSSTIVALMQQYSDRPVKTFSIGFEDQDYDEARYARAVANHLGTDHTDLYVTPSEAMAVIPQIPSIYDEPFSDSSQIPTFLVSQLARNEVTVSLSGDGGDELFGGYNRYYWGRVIWRSIGWMPVKLRALVANGLSMLSPWRWRRGFELLGPIMPNNMIQPNAGDKIHKLAEVLKVGGREELYLRLISHWKDADSLVVNGTDPQTLISDRSQWPVLPEYSQWMMHMDLVAYLPDDILVKVDRASMAVSLEVRVPMLDHRLVEFAARIPMHMKIRHSERKWLLRQLLYRYVPKSLIDRPKMGFGIPIDSWLRDPLRDWVETLLDESRLKREGFFDPAPIRRKWREHLSGTRNWQYYLWDVLMFQAWLEASH